MKTHDPADMNGKAEHEAEHGGEETGTFIAFDEVLADLVAYMEPRGYLMAPDPLGKYCGWSFYLTDYIRIDGCNVSNSRRLIKTVTNTSALRKMILSWVRYEQGQNRSKTWMDKAIKAYTSLFENTTNGNAMNSVAKSSDEVDSRVLDTQGGTGYGNKVLPLFQFVPEHLRDLDVMELLHVLPDAEATMLMMMLGRGLWGAKGQVTLDGRVIDHRWRGWCLLHSDIAGMGKSFFIQLLEKVVSSLGYVCQDLPTEMSSKFNWGKPATADFALRDDFNSDVQHSFMKNASVKIIASGGLMTTEDKGQDMQCGVKTTAVIIGCTNYNKQAQYIGADAGHISRANVLSTKSTWALSKGEQKTLYSQWYALAAKHEVTLEALMMHLLVKSQEMFKEHMDANTLHATYESLRLSYAVRPGLTSLKDMCTATAHLVAFGVAIDKYMSVEEKEDKVRTLLSEYGSQYLLATIAATVSGIGRDSDFFPKGVTASNTKTIKRSIHELIRSIDSESPQSMFNKVSQLIHSSDGYKYPGSVSAYYSQICPEEFVAKMHEYSAWTDDEKKVVSRQLEDSLEILLK